MRVAAHSLLALALVSCSTESADDTSSSGSESVEVQEATAVESTTTDTTNASLLLGVLSGGDSGAYGSPDDQAERERAAAARRAAREAERAERQTACAAQSIASGRPRLPALQSGSGPFDQARRLYDGREPTPAPTGPTVADVGDWARERFAPWVQQRLARMRELEGLAAEVPPAEKAILAALSGHLYIDLAEVLLQNPIPAEIEQDPDARAAYRDAMIEHVDPLLQQAAQRFQWCTNTATPAWRAHCAEAENWATYATCSR